MSSYRNLAKESSLIPTPRMLERNGRDVQSMVLLPAGRDKEEGPTVINFCLPSGMLPLSQKAVVRGRFKGRPKTGGRGKQRNWDQWAAGCEVSSCVCWWMPVWLLQVHPPQFSSIHKVSGWASRPVLLRGVSMWIKYREQDPSDTRT